MLNGNYASREVRAGGGIGPGSAFATFEILGLLFSEVRAIVRIVPEIRLSVFVDDFICLVQGKDDDSFVNTVFRTRDLLVERVEGKLGMPFDVHKGSLVAGLPRTARLVRKILGLRAG